MRYVSSKINAKVSDDIYRFYISNALKILTGNTARFAGGTELTKSYYDIMHNEEIAETEKQNEIEAENVISKIKSQIAKVRG